MHTLVPTHDFLHFSFEKISLFLQMSFVHLYLSESIFTGMAGHSSLIVNSRIETIRNKYVIVSIMSLGFSSNEEAKISYSYIAYLAFHGNWTRVWLIRFLLQLLINVYSILGLSWASRIDERYFEASIRLDTLVVTIDADRCLYV